MAVLSVLGGTGSTVASGRQTSPCSWQVVPSPNRNPARLDNALRDVVVISNDDAWAVGTASVPQEGGRVRTVVLHWDGIRWRAVSHPTRGGDAFLAISGDAPDDIWIVGVAGPTVGIAERWDGATWLTVALARPGTRYWHLNGVAAIAPDDVWAVGNTAGPGEVGALIEHWDGTRWNVVPNPAATRSASLEDVGGVSSDDLWAVGEIGNLDGSHTRALLEHWDGSAWHLVHGTPPSSFDPKRSEWLFGVAASSSTDVWAVGASNPRAGWIGGLGSRQLVERWNSVSWAFVRAADQGKRALLNDVAVSSMFGAWAVGQSRPFVGSAMTEQWDGSAWSEASSVPPRSTSFLSAIAAGPDGSLWAVGGIGWRHQRTMAMRCV